MKFVLRKSSISPHNGGMSFRDVMSNKSVASSMNDVPEIDYEDISETDFMKSKCAIENNDTHRNYAIPLPTPNQTNSLPIYDSIDEDDADLLTSNLHKVLYSCLRFNY